jgi:hypothetical protein
MLANIDLESIATQERQPAQIAPPEYGSQIVQALCHWLALRKTAFAGSDGDETVGRLAQGFIEIFLP